MSNLNHKRKTQVPNTIGGLREEGKITSYHTIANQKPNQGYCQIIIQQVAILTMQARGIEQKERQVVTVCFIKTTTHCLPVWRYQKESRVRSWGCQKNEKEVLNPKGIKVIKNTGFTQKTIAIKQTQNCPWEGAQNDPKLGK